MKLDSYINISRALLDRPVGKNKHFSFIVEKNKIRAIGWNNYNKTHSISYKYNKEWPRLHSEASAIVKFDGRPKELCNCILINVRLNKDGKVMYSRPCKNCLALINTFSFCKVYFTNQYGHFERLGAT